MNNFRDRVFKFIKRERLYVFLLIFTIFITLSFSFLNHLLKDVGPDTTLDEKSLAGGEIIPAQKIQDALASNPTLYFIFILLFIAFIFFIIAGLIFDIVYLYLNRKKKSPIVKTQSFGPVKWNFWDICKVIIIFLFAQRIIWLVEIFLLSAVPFLQERQNLRLMLSATLVDVIAIGAVLYFVVNKKRESITSLGLTMRKFFGNIKYGIFAYIGLIPILASVMYLTTVVFRIFNIPIEPQPVLIMLREEEHIPSLIYMGLFAAFLGPLFEEIFFRGFVYGVFKKRVGIFCGIIITTAFFAYSHANLASFFPIFCLGILLAYLYEKTGSLIPSITVHMIHNSISLFFLLFIKVIAG